jgi:hypothetical protein
MYDPETMRARFWALFREGEMIRASAAPKRADRDQKIAEHERTIAALNAEIKQIEAPLYDIEQERAVIARALGGKTGAPQ